MKEQPNHLRVASNHEQKGFEIFIFGTSAFKTYNSSIMRQAKEISHTVVLKHQLNTEHYFLLQQNPRRNSTGSFIMILSVYLMKIYSLPMRKLLKIGML